MLTGKFKTESLAMMTGVLTTPRYQDDAFTSNLALVDTIETIAANKACTAAQVALAWVIGRGEHVFALTSTTKLKNLQENLGAYDVKLANNEQATLDALADRVKGDRYDEWGMAGINK